jgi:hypothetical protein
MTARLVYILTTHSMVLVFKFGADCVVASPPSSGSSIEFLIENDGEATLCAKKDPTAGVWLLERDLADLKENYI